MKNSIKQAKYPKKSLLDYSDARFENVPQIVEMYMETNHSLEPFFHMLSNNHSGFRGVYDQDDQLILQIDINVMTVAMIPMDNDEINVQV